MLAGCIPAAEGAKPARSDARLGTLDCRNPADPYGKIAEKTLMLCDHPLYAAPVFRRVIATARQSRP